MRILILGAGAIGGYYGARFMEGGAQVVFMVRPGRRYRLEEHGLQVESALGNVSAKVSTCAEGRIEGQFDAVVLACKAFDLERAIDAVAPAVARGAMVLPFLNGLLPYDQLDARFGRGQVLGGVAYIATTLGDDGVIRRCPADHLPRHSAQSHVP